MTSDFLLLVGSASLTSHRREGSQHTPAPRWWASVEPPVGLVGLMGTPGRPRGTAGGWLCEMAGAVLSSAEYVHGSASPSFKALHGSLVVLSKWRGMGYWIQRL